MIPLEGCALGIDVGSTSTDLVLMDPDGGLIDFQYLRTAGDPEGAVRRGLEHLRERFGELPLLAVAERRRRRQRLSLRRREMLVRHRSPPSWTEGLHRPQRRYGV